MILLHNNREIEIQVYGRYADDLTVESAQYLDGNDEVSDEVVDEIMNSYADEIYIDWYESRMAEAESRCSER